MRMLIGILLLISSTSFSQSSKLDNYEREKMAKVAVGSSTEEIRRILGKPFSVNPGFPESERQIITMYPEHAGQLNYSTWVYVFSPLSIRINAPDTTYEINDRIVDRDLFYGSLESDSVYYLNDEMIFPSMGRGYRTTKKRGLRVVAKQSMARTKAKVKSYNQRFEPILCVIFDRGTQVVSGGRMYFRVVD